jgi:hypothetical protein
MATAGFEAVDTQVAEVTVEAGALAIRVVPAEIRATALATAEAERDERERRWREAVQRQRGQDVRPQ